MPKYAELLTMIANGDELECARLFPALAQWHTPIYDTLTWGEMYPLLGQWLKQTMSAWVNTKTTQVGQITISEWLCTLKSGEELLLALVIDPTTTHGMDVRMYHSWKPFFGRNQERTMLPIQEEWREIILPEYRLSASCYYLPANGRTFVSQQSAEITAKLAYVVTCDIHAIWQSATMDVIEYSTATHQIGVLIVELNNTREVTAIRSYNDWE